MPALTDLPELIGFFSYSRDDDRDSEGGLTLLRRRIQSELRGQLGRSEKTLRLFQDAEAIPPGTLWEGEISGAIEQSAFFIPIISPRVVQSEHCGVEFRKFLDREKGLGRTDLIFRRSQPVDATRGQLAINNDDGLPNARPNAFSESLRN